MVDGGAVAFNLCATLHVMSRAGGTGKAAYLSRFGYSQTDWRRLEHDLRAQHLILDAAPGRPSLYGTKYEIVEVLVGPNGATGRIRTVWIVWHGEASLASSR
jgi:hypothetical protein